MTVIHEPAIDDARVRHDSVPKPRDPASDSGETASAQSNVPMPTPTVLEPVTDERHARPDRVESDGSDLGRVASEARTAAPESVAHLSSDALSRHEASATLEPVKPSAVVAVPANDDQGDAASAVAPVQPQSPATQAAAPTNPAASPPVMVEPQPLALAEIAGRYRFVGGAAQKQRRLDAIDRSAASVTFLFRSIAKSRLTEETAIWPGFAIAINGDDVEITRSGHTTRGVARAGVGTANMRDGDTFTATFEWTNERLVEGAMTKRGGRKVVYRLDPASGTMRVDVTLTSPHMDIPLRYSLSYRRS